MQKFIAFLVISLCSILSSKALRQPSTEVPRGSRFFSDFFMGPYLFVEHIPYDAVLLFGSRLGFESETGVALMAEYAVGQQQDAFHTLGLTHHASLQVSCFLAQREKRFRPYVFCGSGFLEFKSFTNDKYGIGSFAGLGVETRLANTAHGFIEPRYLNIAQMNLGGKHELGVFWGLRLGF